MSTFEVQYVELSPFAGPYHSSASVRTDASWNLARVSSRDKLANQDPVALTYKYGYRPDPGNGVDIYVVDTGLSFLVCFYRRSLNMCLCRYPNRARTRTFPERRTPTLTFA